ncbi:hypothetical protein RND81_06G134900 [Saponaria officinalis]|uniref:Uncharacterized protein n=1 Tax=Saponaria officinalis TaxID=3572 RepID=A0AAW1KAZ5_SAPOF
MGNCCMNGSKSATVWAGDDWAVLVPEKEGLIGDGRSSSEVGNIGGQVRIKISKRQLDKLLRKVDNHILYGNNNDNSKMKNKIKGGEIILKKIIDKCDHFEVHHLRQWKPALQSIPEIN